MPWAEPARTSLDVHYLAERIASAAGLIVRAPPSSRPHGRLTWTLVFPGFNDPRWVDLSAFQPAGATHPDGLK